MADVLPPFFFLMIEMLLLVLANLSLAKDATLYVPSVEPSSTTIICLFGYSGFDYGFQGIFNASLFIVCRDNYS